jgi:hypothetical protein
MTQVISLIEVHIEELLGSGFTNWRVGIGTRHNRRRTSAQLPARDNRPTKSEHGKE